MVRPFQPDNTATVSLPVFISELSLRRPEDELVCVVCWLHTGDRPVTSLLTGQSAYRVTSSTDTVNHRRRLPYGNGGDCPMSKTPHRAPPCARNWTRCTISSLFLMCRKLRLFLRKSTKNCCHRSCTFDSNMHQIVRRLGLRPRHH